MKALLYSFILQWRLDIRDKGVFITYYIIPLAFFLIMGNIFSSVLPDSKETLIPSMTIFSVTMGAIAGSPSMLVEVFGSEIKKSYQVGNVPLIHVTIVNFLSAFVHSLITSFIIYLTAPMLFGAIRPENAIIYFILLIVFICVSLFLGTTLGLCVKKTSQLTMVSQIIFLPSIMLSGIMFPVSMLPPFLQTIGKLFPATWSYEMMHKAQISLSMLTPILLICLLCIIICLVRLRQIKQCD